MSAALFDIRFSPELGRHLVARCALSPGQLVVQQEPFCAVLYDEQLALRCDLCFRVPAPGEALRRCSRSRHARYCSREHQLEAWAAGYKQECQALVTHAPRVPPPTVRLAARALWRYLRQQDGAEQLEHCTWSSVQALLSHWESVPDERKVQYAQMAVLAREFAFSGLAAAATADPSQSGREALPSVQEVAHLLARFACNNHTICDEELRPLGVGLYPLGALLNHSCRPNCMQSFGPQGRIQFRSLVNIQPGEPLTISYVELAATRQERREELAAYYFDIEPSLPPPSPHAAEAGPGSDRMCQSSSPSPTTALGISAPGTSAPSASVLPAPYSRSCLRPSAPVAELPFQLDDWPGAPAQLPDGALEPSSHLPRGLLRVYSSNNSTQGPPWPCDEGDDVLTQLVMMQPSTSSSAASESAVQRLVPMPGGIQVHLVSQQLGSLGEDFMELDQRDEGNGEQDSNERDQVLEAVDTPAAGSHDEQVVEVDCWGSWAVRSVEAAVSRLGDHSALSSIDEEDGASRSSPEVSVGALAKRLGAAAHLQSRAEQLGSKGQKGEAVLLLQNALLLVDRSDDHPVDDAPAAAGSAGLPRLGQFHLFRMRLSAALLKAVIEEGSSWEIALGVARDLQPVYQRVYPPTSPNLGLHFATLAKLELLQGQVARAQEAAMSSLSILRATHCRSGTLGSRGQGVLEQVEQCLSQAQAEATAGALSQ